MNPLEKEAEDAFNAYWETQKGNIVTSKDTFTTAFLLGRRAGLEAAKETIQYLIYQAEK